MTMERGAEQAAAQSGLLAGITTTIEMIRVADVQVDRSYQRPLSIRAAKAKAAKFEPLGVGCPLVSRRDDGSLWALDGQHRFAAIGLAGVEMQRCEVAEGLSHDQEAYLYNLRADARQNRATDNFKARLEMGDPDAVAIVTVLARLGIHITFEARNTSNRKDVNSCQAVATLLDIYTQGGAEVLHHLLQIAKQAWPDTPEALSQRVLLGLHSFHGKYKGRYDTNQLIARLSGVGITKINADTKTWGGYQPVAFSRQVQLLYDKGRTTRRLEPKGE